MQLRRVHARLERGQVKTEDPRLPDQAFDATADHCGRADAAADRLQISVKIVHIAVAGFARYPARGFGQHVAQPRDDERQLASKRLARLVGIARRELAGRVGQLALVSGERLAQGIAEHHRGVGLRELAAEHRQPVGQQRQGKSSVSLGSLENRRRRDVGVAVHVGTGPASESQRGPSSPPLSGDEPLRVVMG